MTVANLLPAVLVSHTGTGLNPVAPLTMYNWESNGRWLKSLGPGHPHGRPGKKFLTLITVNQ